LARGRIVVLLSFAAASAFLCHTRTEQAHSPAVSTLPWAAHLPSKVPFAWGDSDPYLIYGSLDPRESALQTASRSVQPVFVQLIRAPHTQTHRYAYHATCDICSNRPHLCTGCMRCCLKVKSKVVNLYCTLHMILSHLRRSGMARVNEEIVSFNYGLPVT